MKSKIKKSVTPGIFYYILQMIREIPEKYQAQKIVFLPGNWESKLNRSVISGLSNWEVR
jgi:hypothetical protein